MPAQPRILILTVDAGFGHRSAANALAAAFESLYGDSCAIVVANPFDSPTTPRWLRNTQSDYDKIARKMPEVYRLGFDLSDRAVARRAMENAMSAFLLQSVRDTVAEARPDAIVSTFPLYLPALATLVKTEKLRIPVVTVLTDLVRMHQTWFNPVSDVTIVPNDIVRDLALSSGLDPAGVEVVGIPVHPELSRGVRDRAGLRTELGLDPALTTILAVGSKRVGKLLDVLDVINHSGFPVQLLVVAGGDDAVYGKLMDIEWHVPARVHNFVRNLPTMMKAADLVVAKAGGLIVNEALAVGLPLMLIDILPGQEVGNAEYVVANGAGVVVKDPLSCLEQLRHWFDNGGERLAAMSVNASRLGRPDAAVRIAARVHELATRPS